MMMATGEKIQWLHPLKFSTASPFEARSNFSDLNDYFEKQPLDRLLHWGLSTFGDKLAQVTSFGPTGMVILDRLARLRPGLRVITLDTDFLFEETYALWEEVQRRYPIQLDIRRPALSPEAQAQQFGADLWALNPDQCCYLRKVKPLQDALQGLEAWLTGLRRDQSPTRSGLPLISWDPAYGLVKINPLAYWSRAQVWDYIRAHNVPYNSLHDRGYASIGCTHCTRPSSNPGDERSGRWQGRVKLECGIHLDKL